LTGFAWPCRGFGMEANGRRARDWENAFFSRTKACADGGAAAFTEEGKTVLVAPDERGEETIGEWRACPMKEGGWDAAAVTVAICPRCLSVAEEKSARARRAETKWLSLL